MPTPRSADFRVDFTCDLEPSALHFVPEKRPTPNKDHLAPRASKNSSSLKEHISQTPRASSDSKPIMSTHTIATLPRISREDLAALVRSKSPSLAVIDVRDSDYVGGHILNCMNVPVHQHDHRMPELVRTLKDKDTVVFHCALSQQRGPSSALRYLREKERMDRQGVEGGGQKVYVLEGGFVKWQEM